MPGCDLTHAWDESQSVHFAHDRRPIFAGRSKYVETEFILKLLGWLDGCNIFSSFRMLRVSAILFYFFFQRIPVSEYFSDLIMQIRRLTCMFLRHTRRRFSHFSAQRVISN